MIAKGRKNPFVKLSDDQVREILALKGTTTYKKLGLMFGVRDSYISRLFGGTRRKAITC
jgi:hypothetical protein